MNKQITIGDQKYNVSIDWSEEDQVFIARANDLSGVVTHGNTEAQALKMVREAITLHIDLVNHARKQSLNDQKLKALSWIAGDVFHMTDNDKKKLMEKYRGATDTEILEAIVKIRFRLVSKEQLLAQKD